MSRRTFPCILVAFLILLTSCTSPGTSHVVPVSTKQPKGKLPVTTTSTNNKTVFLIMMENHNWSDVKHSPSATYINQTLLPIASYAEHYFNPPGIHPSEPNYLWLEAGTNFGISNDNDPAVNHQSTTQHFVTLLDHAHISWKSYQEGISGTVCPLTGDGLYAPKQGSRHFYPCAASAADDECNESCEN